MPFVLDASITACWAFADESSALADIADAQLSTDTAIVPMIWWYEIRNLLVINERRQRLSQAESTRFLRNLSAYPIKIDEMIDQSPIFSLARQYQLSIYDAAYLALAQREGIPLATLDHKLQSAAQSAGIPLLA